MWRLGVRVRELEDRLGNVQNSRRARAQVLASALEVCAAFALVLGAGRLGIIFDLLVILIILSARLIFGVLIILNALIILTIFAVTLIAFRLL